MNCDVLKDAAIIQLYFSNFCDAAPLLLHQWYLYNLSRLVRRGAADPYPWIVSSLSSQIPPESLELESHISTKKRRRSKKRTICSSAILTTSTAVSLTFSSYRVVICLDISKSSFTLTDEGLPFTTLTDMLLAVASELASVTEGSTCIAKNVFVSIIAHAPETDSTFSLWQGDLRGDLDISLLLNQLRVRIDNAEELAMRCLMGPGTSANQFPNTDTFLQAILFHLNLMPQGACPKAILLTGGSLSVHQDSALHREFARQRISLHLLVEQLPCDRPVGFFSNLGGLRLLAEHIEEGSLEVIRSSKKVDIAAMCAKHFGESFFAMKMFLPHDANRDDGRYSHRQIPLNMMSSIGSMREVLLQSYECSGATVEHLVCIRRAEGFRLINITQEFIPTPSNSGQTSQVTARAPFASKRHFFAPAASRHMQGEVLTIHLEKFVTKMSSILYDITYKRDVAARRAGVIARLNNASSSNIQSTGSGQTMNLIRPTPTGLMYPLVGRESGITGGVERFDWPLELFKEEHMWTAGPLTIHVRRRCMKGGRHALNDEQTVKHIVSLAESILEKDKAFADLLGGAFMPGWLPPTEMLQQGNGSGGTLRLGDFKNTQTTNAVAKSTAVQMNASHHGSLPGTVNGGNEANQSEFPKKPRGPRWPSARGMAGLISFIHEAGQLDSYLSSFFFLRAGGAATSSLSASATVAGDHSEIALKMSAANNFVVRRLVNGHISRTRNRSPMLDTHGLKQLYELSLSKLPHTEGKMVSSTRWLFVTSVKNGGNTLRKAGNAFDLRFGVIVVDLKVKNGIFLSLRIYKLSMGCGHLSARSKLVYAAVLDSLRSLGFSPFKLSMDLSLLSIAQLETPCLPRRNLMASTCLLSSTRRTNVSIRDRLHIDMIMAELVQAKVAYGFQHVIVDFEEITDDFSGDHIFMNGTVVANHVPSGTRLASSSGLDSITSSVEGDPLTVVTYLTAVCLRSPAGAGMESLLQCRIVCGVDYCTVDYFWQKGSCDAKLGAYSRVNAASSKSIEDIVAALTVMDEKVFRLYEAVIPLIQNAAMLSSSLMMQAAHSVPIVSLTQDSSADSPSRGCSALLPDWSPRLPQRLQAKDWENILEKSTDQHVTLPQFGPRSSRPHTDLLNRWLELMLRNSLLKCPLGLLPVVIIEEVTESGYAAQAKECYSRKDRYVCTAGDTVILLELPRSSDEDARNLDLRDFNKQDSSDDAKSTDAPKPMAEAATLSEASDAPLDPHSSHMPRAATKIVEETITVKAQVCCIADVQVFTLRLPTLSFVDGSNMTAVGKLLVPLAASSTSKQSSSGSARSSEAPQQRDRIDGFATAGRDAVDNLRAYLWHSHMRNFTKVLSAAMKLRHSVSPAEVQLGLDRCCQSIYEVDMSVMCKKKVVANAANALVTTSKLRGKDTKSLISLRSAFENSLGQLLLGVADGNVFVFIRNPDEDAGQTISAVHPSSSTELISQPVGNPELLPAQLSSVLEISPAHTSPYSAISLVADKPRGSRRRSIPSLISPTSPQTVNDAAHAVVSTSVEDIAISVKEQIMGAPSRSSSVEDELSSSLPSWLTLRPVFVRFLVVARILGEDTGAAAVVQQHLLPSTSQALTTNLFSLCASFGQALESLQAPASASEVVLRMVCMFAPDDDAFLEHKIDMPLPPSTADDVSKPPRGASLGLVPSALKSRGLRESVPISAAGTYGGDTEVPGRAEYHGHGYGRDRSRESSSSGLRDKDRDVDPPEACALRRVSSIASVRSVQSISSVLSAGTHNTVGSKSHYTVPSTGGATLSYSSSSNLLKSLAEAMSSNSMPPNYAGGPMNPPSSNSFEKDTQSALQSRGDTTTPLVYRACHHGTFFDKLTQEMKVFVASDTLNSLQIASSATITAETLVLVQHCLSDIPLLVKNIVVALDFVSPSSAKELRPSSLQFSSSASSSFDSVVTAFESELREEIYGLSKIGDTLYTRYWKMRGKIPTTSGSHGATPEISESPSRVDDCCIVPCWILISLNHNPQIMGNATDGTATTNMKISLSLRITEIDAARPGAFGYAVEESNVVAPPSSGLQDAIAAELQAVLEKCNFKVNQRLLLRDLLVTKVASPYLIAPPASLQRAPAAIAHTQSTTAAISTAPATTASTSTGTLPTAATNSSVGNPPATAQLVASTAPASTSSPPHNTPYIAPSAALASADATAPASSTSLSSMSTSTASITATSASSDATSPVKTPTTNATQISTSVDAIDKPLVSPPSSAVAGSKGRFFNNSVPPRRRPQNPALAMIAGKMGPPPHSSQITAGSSSGDISAAASPLLAGPGGLNGEVSTPALVAPVYSIFSPGQFSCPRKGEIVCAIQGWAAMLYESAVRHLETSALSQFAVINHDRHFVAQDAKGDIFYMSFDPQHESESVRLGVYGVGVMDKQFSEQLQISLEHRLIEYIAKRLSDTISRNVALPPSYLTFLRQSGASRHLVVKFRLPCYVQDVYFYCAVARQVLLSSNLITKLVISGAQSNEGKKTNMQVAPAAVTAAASGVSSSNSSLSSAAMTAAAAVFLPAPVSELLHPAGFGYNLLGEGTHSAFPFVRKASVQPPNESSGDDVDNDDKEDEDVDDFGPDPRLAFNRPMGLGMRSSSGSIAFGRPGLVRQKHVEEEEDFDSTKLSPVFFIKKKNVHRTVAWDEQRFDDRLVVWQQPEFNFLYNVLQPLPASSPQQSKNAVKQIGFGLALVEFYPRPVSSASAAPQTQGIVASATSEGSAPVLLTGTQRALEDDVRALEVHLRAEGKLELLPVGGANNAPLMGHSVTITVPAPEADHDIRHRSRSSYSVGQAFGSSNTLPRIHEGTSNTLVETTREVSSVGEIHLRISPTVPMQSQVLADFCRAYFEKALLIYCVERVFAASGAGELRLSTSTNSTPTCSPFTSTLSLDLGRIPSNAALNEAGTNHNVFSFNRQAQRSPGSATVRSTETRSGAEVSTSPQERSRVPYPLRVTEDRFEHPSSDKVTHMLPMPRRRNVSNLMTTIPESTRSPRSPPHSPSSSQGSLSFGNVAHSDPYDELDDEDAERRNSFSVFQHQQPLSPLTKSIHSLPGAPHYASHSFKRQVNITAPESSQFSYHSSNQNRPVLSVPIVPGMREFSFSVADENYPLYSQRVVEETVEALRLPSNSLLPSTTLADFLRLLHSAIKGAKATHYVLNNSSGIMHFRFLLPQQKAQVVRTQVLAKILELYPFLRPSMITCLCASLFLAPANNEENVAQLKINEKQGSEALLSKSQSMASISNRKVNRIGARELTVNASADAPVDAQTKAPMRAPLRWCHLHSAVPINATVALLGVTSLSAPSSGMGATADFAGGYGMALRRLSMTKSPYDITSTVPFSPHTASPHTASSSPRFSEGISTSTNFPSHSNSRLHPQLSYQSRLSQPPLGAVEGHAVPFSSSGQSGLSPTQATIAAAVSAAAASHGDLRMFAGFEGVVASSLPSWLRQRRFCVEISVSTSGLYVHFFNVAFVHVQAICEIAASVTSTVVREHNEGLKGQLAQLGIIRGKRSIDALQMSTHDNTVATATSPRVAAKGSQTNTLSSVNHNSATAGVMSNSATAGITGQPSPLIITSQGPFPQNQYGNAGPSPLLTQASPLPSSAQSMPPSVAAVGRAGLPIVAPAPVAPINKAKAIATTEPPTPKLLSPQLSSSVEVDLVAWVDKSLKRLSWEARAIERLFFAEGKTKTNPISQSSLESAAAVLNRVPIDAWRGGVVKSSIFLPLPLIKGAAEDPTALQDRVRTRASADGFDTVDRSVESDADPSFERFCDELQAFCVSSDFDMVRSPDHGTVYIIAAIPRAAVVAVSEVRSVRTQHNRHNLQHNRSQNNSDCNSARNAAFAESSTILPDRKQDLSVNWTNATASGVISPLITHLVDGGQRFPSGESVSAPGPIFHQRMSQQSSDSAADGVDEEGREGGRGKNGIESAKDGLEDNVADSAKGRVLITTRLIDVMGIISSVVESNPQARGTAFNYLQGKPSLADHSVSGDRLDVAVSKGSLPLAGTSAGAIMERPVVKLLESGVLRAAFALLHASVTDRLGEDVPGSGPRALQLIRILAPLIGDVITTYETHVPILSEGRTAEKLPSSGSDGFNVTATDAISALTESCRSPSFRSSEFSAIDNWRERVSVLLGGSCTRRGGVISLSYDAFEEVACRSTADSQKTKATSPAMRNGKKKSKKLRCKDQTANIVTKGIPTSSVVASPPCLTTVAPVQGSRVATGLVFLYETPSTTAGSISVLVVTYDRSDLFSHCNRARQPDEPLTAGKPYSPVTALSVLLTHSSNSVSSCDHNVINAESTHKGNVASLFSSETLQRSQSLVSSEDRDRLGTNTSVSSDDSDDFLLKHSKVFKGLTKELLGNVSKLLEAVVRYVRIERAWAVVHTSPVLPSFALDGVKSLKSYIQSDAQVPVPLSRDENNKNLLMLMLRYVPAVTLRFLGFLRQPLLLLTADVDSLRTFVTNISAAFPGRCSAFLEDKLGNERVKKTVANSFGESLQAITPSSPSASCPGQSGSTQRASNFHIIIAGPVDKNWAVHICVTLRSSVSLALSSVTDSMHSKDESTCDESGDHHADKGTDRESHVSSTTEGPQTDNLSPSTEQSCTRPQQDVEELNRESERVCLRLLDAQSQGSPYSPQEAEVDTALSASARGDGEGDVRVHREKELVISQLVDVILYTASSSITSI